MCLFVLEDSPVRNNGDILAFMCFFISASITLEKLDVILSSESRELPLLWALLEAFRSSWVIKHCMRAASEGVLSYTSAQIQRSEGSMFSTIQGLCSAEFALFSCLGQWLGLVSALPRRKGQAGTSCSFSMLQRGSGFPLEGSPALLRIPNFPLPRAVLAAPSLCSPSAQGILEPLLKDKRDFVLHSGFFVEDGLGLFCCSVD